MHPTAELDQASAQERDRLRDVAVRAGDFWCHLRAARVPRIVAAAIVAGWAGSLHDGFGIVVVEDDGDD